MDNDISRWAQALLAFDNLRFVVVDTTSVKKDSDIIRFFTLNKHGFIEESMLIFPCRYPGECNTSWTGITPDMIEHAETLPDRWPDIREALTGRFVLAYGFDFIQEHLNENVQHYGLKPVHLIGDCLMQTAVKYFRSTNYGMKLTDACARIGHALPARPNAEQRAQGQLALLKAMSQGITSAPAPVESHIDQDEDLLGDLDSHPF